MGESLCFDRVAHEYDKTRGGVERARHYATELGPLLPEGRLLEIGVGTGVIGGGLREMGRDVVGIDLSPAMLSRARARLPGRVAVGDAQQLPIASDAVDGALSVWVLHLVGDRAEVLREARRVVVPGGCYVVVVPECERPDLSDDLGRIRWEMEERARAGKRKPDHPDELAPLALAAGWEAVDRFTLVGQPFHTTPREEATRIESRTWSRLWDIDAAEWTRVVAPALSELRALDGPDEPRSRCRAEQVLRLR